MVRYDCICSGCGQVNRGLDLKETDGWMECSQCGHIEQFALSQASVSAGHKVPGLAVKKADLLCLFYQYKRSYTVKNMLRGHQLFQENEAVKA